MPAKRKFILAILLLAFVSTTLASAAGQEKIVGRALYEKLRKDRTLIKTDGLSRVSWTPDGQAFFLAEDKTFKRVDALTGEKSPLFDDAKILAAYNALTALQATALPFTRFDWQADGAKIVFQAANRNFLCDLASGKLVDYEPERLTEGVRGRMYGEVYSPDAKWRAFTRDYDLYVRNLEGSERRLTTGGSADLRNGFPDWVYPEELNQYDAYWWSPDSKKIAYMQFDESPVAKYPIVHDVAPKPELELQGYPKSGANNPIVRLFVVDVESRKIVRLDTGMETNVYLYRGRWTPDGREFTFLKLNRLQNLIEFWAADPATGATRLVLGDGDPCYIDESIDRVFLKDAKRFLWLSERSGSKEIYLHDLTGKLLKPLTAARLPVSNVLGVDEAAGWVYFTGFEARGTETHLYRVRLDGSGFQKMTKEPGTHMVSLSPDNGLYVDTFSSYTNPGRTALFKADGTEVRELGGMTETQAFKDLALLAPEPFVFKSADGKYDLDGILYKPAHFQESEKYPLLLSVYGGPGAKGVTNRYAANDGNQALAQLGFLVVRLDHRGASGRGKAFQNLQYLNLGQVELEDHVAVVKHLAARPYVDATRVGIFGHSYGGYMTAIALLKAPDVFHVGVAGAPVTDWRNYDSIYTERYMRRPQDNPEGYEKGSCLTYAKDLKGKLFIHHGAVDDNVHPGNSVQLLQALLKENKKFDFMLYPEQRHGIMFPRYAEARVDYFVEHLKPEVK
jgi:dipeptidyl-peptidase-4